MGYGLNTEDIGFYFQHRVGEIVAVHSIHTVSVVPSFIATHPRREK
jgi:hypothetical protein